MFPEKPKLAIISLYYRNIEEKILKINNLLESLIEKYSKEDVKITLTNELYFPTNYLNLREIKNYLIPKINSKCQLNHFLLVTKDDLTEQWHFRDKSKFKTSVNLSFFNLNHKSEMIPIDYYENLFDLDQLKQYFKNISYDTVKVLTQEKKGSKRHGFLIGKSVFNIINIMEYIYHLEAKVVKDLIYSLPESTWEMVDSNNDYKIILKSKLEEYLKKSIDNKDLFSLHDHLIRIINSSILKLYIL